MLYRLLLFASTVLISWFSHLYPAFAQPPKAPQGPAPVVVGRVVKQSFAERQSFVGTVNPLKQVVVGTAVEGRVAEMLVNRADRVTGHVVKDGKLDPTTGQVIALLETKTLDLQIDAAKTLFDLAQQAFAELSANLPKEMEIAAARELETKARLELARREFDRLTRLNTQPNAVSELEFDQARSQFDANVQLAAQAATDSKRLEATREFRLKQVELRLLSAQQEITRLEDLKSKYTIRAPFDGYVVNKLTENGAWVQSGDPIAEIAHLDSLEFIFNVPQEFVGRIQLALDPAAPPMIVTIEIDGIEQKLTGKVTAIIPQADLRSRTFPVRAQVSNILLAGQHLLKPGMIGYARASLGKEREMLLVKKDALVLGGATPVVYKVTNSNDNLKVTNVNVEVGMSVGNWIEVTGNLEPDDQVVIQGNERLRPDQEVSILSSSDEVPLPEGTQE